VDGAVVVKGSNVREGYCRWGECTSKCGGSAAWKRVRARGREEGRGKPSPTLRSGCEAVGGDCPGAGAVATISETGIGCRRGDRWRLHPKGGADCGREVRRAWLRPEFLICYMVRARDGGEKNFFVA